MDKVLHKQVLKHHITYNALIPPWTLGGTLGNTTTTDIAIMLDEWEKALEKGDEIAVIILDQIAAYDVISHKILFQKQKT